MAFRRSGRVLLWTTLAAAVLAIAFAFLQSSVPVPVSGFRRTSPTVATADKGGAKCVQNANSTKVGPPRLMIAPGQGSRVLDVNEEIREKRMSPLTAWSGEARDADWARAVEEKVPAMILADLRGVGDIGVTMECRSTLCRIQLDGPDELMPAANFIAKTLYCGRGCGPLSAREILVAYRGSFPTRLGPYDIQETASLVTLLKEQRDVNVKNIRDGKQAGWLRWVPLDKWPL